MVDFKKLLDRQQQIKEAKESHTLKEFEIPKHNNKIEGTITGRTISHVITDDIEEVDNLDFSLNDFDFADDTNEETIKTFAANKTPKETLIIFLKESQLDEEYHIPFNGSYESAKMFIHRMRVELSRFRNQIIKLNKPLNHFHVLTKNIIVNSEDKCTIILIKTHERKRFDSAKIESDVLAFLTIPE